MMEQWKLFTVMEAAEGATLGGVEEWDSQG